MPFVCAIFPLLVYAQAKHFPFACWQGKQNKSTQQTRKTRQEKRKEDNQKTKRNRMKNPAIWRGFLIDNFYFLLLQKICANALHFLKKNCELCPHFRLPAGRVRSRHPRWQEPLSVSGPFGPRGVLARIRVRNNARRCIANRKAVADFFISTICLPLPIVSACG